MFNLQKEQMTMKKIWNLMLVALVMLGAAACTEKDANVDANEKAGFSFYAEVADATRATIEKDGEVWNTVWEEDDKLYVTAGETSYEFLCADVESGKFTCSADGVESLVGQSVTITTDGKHHSLQGKKALYTTATVESFGPDANIKLEALTSFFRYTFNGEGEVKLTLSAAAFRNEAGEAVNEVVISGNGEQFVAFWPTGEEVTLTYAIDGVTAKQKAHTFAAGMVYNLGTFSKTTDYGIVGSFQTPTTWDVANPVKMRHVEADWNWVVAENVELYLSDEIKIVKGNSWDVSFGAKDAVLVAEEGTEYTLTNNDGKNIRPTKNGKFNIYFNEVSHAFKLECVEEYVDLKVTITINNKANWSPLYIVLKDGNTLLTAADGDLVTDNKYVIGGEFIGKSLTCKFISGDKATEEMTIAINKDGASITLEETIIKLKVQLNTANAKQWWGDTMKIHAWGTGTSFDTSWPGNTMTSEGNYTWSIIVPSELVGKTINFLVHNGNGWQSKDSKVTISAEGNLVTGSSIGIN